MTKAEWTKDPDFRPKYYKAEPGRNVVVFESDGETITTSFGKKAVRFKVNKGQDWDIQSIALLSDLNKIYSKQGSLVGSKISFDKTGEGRSTRYTNVTLKE